MCFHDESHPLLRINKAHPQAVTLSSAMPSVSQSHLHIIIPSINQEMKMSRTLIHQPVDWISTRNRDRFTNFEASIQFHCPSWPKLFRKCHRFLPYHVSTCYVLWWGRCGGKQIWPSIAWNLLFASISLRRDIDFVCESETGKGRAFEQIIIITLAQANIDLPIDGRNWTGAWRSENAHVHVSIDLHASHLPWDRNHDTDIALSCTHTHFRFSSERKAVYEQRERFQ